MQHIMNNNYLREPDSRSARRVKQVSEGDFTVDGKIRVQFGDDFKYPHCDCSEWRHSRLPCKHFCLIFSCVPGWSWEKLSSLYRESPLLNLDEMTLNNMNTNQVSSDDWTDPPEPDMVPQQEEEDTEQPQTLPLPPRKRTKTKVLQTHCRTIMKEIISATYLIKDEKCLSELADDIDDLNAKAKTMMPSEDGVPMEEVPSNGVSKKKRVTVPVTAKKPSKMVPPPLQTHGAKKHPANGRFGAKAEWQRKLIGQKSKSSGSSRSNLHAPVKRSRLATNGPSKMKVKLQANAKDQPLSTSEPNINCTRDSSAQVPATEENKPVPQTSSNVQAAAQSPSLLGII